MPPTLTFHRYWKWALYTLLCHTADVIDIACSAVISPRPRSSTTSHVSDIAHLSDEELSDLISRSPCLPLDFTDDIIFRSVRQLTPNTVSKPARVNVAKGIDDCAEGHALDLVLNGSTIPVPRVHRVIQLNILSHAVVMDYIKGPTLAKVWPTLSLWRKINVAFTLRRYVRQLRSLKASPTTPPGPISADGPCVCSSPPVFGQVRSERGPFASYAELSSFLNQRYQLSLTRFEELPEAHPWRELRCDDSEAMVLTHQDIAPRNIIVGEDGQLWLVDWGWAGFYPPWFEFVAMRQQAEWDRSMNCAIWKALIPFICGPYFMQEGWWEYMAAALYFK